MPRYIFAERMACTVTWHYAVEAENEEEAWDKYTNGDPGEAIGQPEIGDSIDLLAYGP